MNGYLDFDLIKKYPNKYNLTPKNISTVKVLDWDRLKEHTSDYTKGYQFCSHFEGCEKEGQPFNNKNLFWIGFFLMEKLIVILPLFLLIPANIVVFLIEIIIILKSFIL